MNGLDAVSTARVLESNIKDYFKDHKSEDSEAEEFEFGREMQSARAPEQTGQMLNTIA